MLKLEAAKEVDKKLNKKIKAVKEREKEEQENILKKYVKEILRDKKYYTD